MLKNAEEIGGVLDAGEAGARRLSPPGGAGESKFEPIRTPPEYCWWKPETSDPAQFELQTPHWSPDFEFQDWQQSTESAETANPWQATERILDTTALP